MFELPLPRYTSNLAGTNYRAGQGDLNFHGLAAYEFRSTLRRLKAVAQERTEPHK